ncbi:MAG: DNA polymerase III subunit chi [Pseudomonadota bacterium]
MARVDFYVLSQFGAQSRQAFACRLAEKAWRLDNTVHIHADDRTSAEQIDQLLWTFRDGSFVPHDMADACDASTPICIGYGDVAEPRDLLINLCDTIPTFAETFPRIAELVTSDADARHLSRKRFADYRDKGHTLETHNV